MKRPGNLLLVDIAVGLIAGLVATKAFGYVQEGLYRVMPETVKKREEAVRPGDPAELAALKAAELAGVELKGKRLATGGSVVHYGLGAMWGPVYGLLRRHIPMGVASAGLLSGAAMSLIVDETLTPAMGLSAPNRAYPAITHVRGFAGHLIFGVVTAAVAEALYALIDLVRPNEPKLAPTNGNAG